MKIILTVFIFLFFVSCKDEEILPRECTCSDYVLGSSFKDINGQIIFPKNAGTRFQIILNNNWTWGHNYIVCSDSAFIDELSIKNITDSTFVTISAGVVIGKPDCYSSYFFPSCAACEPIPLIQITNISK